MAHKKSLSRNSMSRRSAMSIVSALRLLSAPVGLDRGQARSMDSVVEAADCSAEMEIAGSATSDQEALDPKTTYEMFPDRRGRWHVRRSDGVVVGVFSQRRAAARFVWHECRDAERLIVTEGLLPA
jgi:hypothetical protein